MAMFENSTITNAGKALIDSWVSGETLTFTSAVTGSGYTDPAELKDLTVLPDVKQTKSIAAQESTAQGEKLTVDVDVVGLAAGYQLKQIGIYAQKGSDTPVLFAVFEDVNGFHIPSETEMPDFAFEFFALLVMSVDGNVALTLDPTQLVTVAMLTDYVAKNAPMQVDAEAEFTGEYITKAKNFSATAEEMKAALRDGKNVEVNVRYGTLYNQEYIKFRLCGVTNRNTSSSGTMWFFAFDRATTAKWLFYAFSMYANAPVTEANVEHKTLGV